MYNRIMKILKILLFFCLLLVVPPVSAASIATPDMLIIVLGDEITGNPNLPPEKRFAAQLEKRLRDGGFFVKVESISQVEMTSADAKKKIDSILARSPDMVILQVAETDIRRGLDPQILKDNMVWMLSGMKQRSIYTIAMMSSAPASKDGNYRYRLGEAISAIGKLSQVYPETLGGIAGNPDLTIGDGYHPNASGVAFMIEGMYRAVDAGLRWRLDVVNRLLIQRNQQPAN